MDEYISKPEVAPVIMIVLFSIDMGIVSAGC